MHNVTAEQIVDYANQLKAAVKEQNWRQIQALDLTIRDVITEYNKAPTPMPKEIAYLKQCHQFAYRALSDARDSVNEKLKKYSESKEGTLAYQMVMDIKE